jgi:hypothetical protein
MDELANWIDRLIPGNFIDIYFVASDLIDVFITDEEIAEIAYFDSLANRSAKINKANSRIPIGKQVI